jgi:hypothetical protein
MIPSSYLLFVRKIRGTQWSKRMIRQKFLREVEKADYDKKDQPRILDWCYFLSTKSSKYKAPVI